LKSSTTIAFGTERDSRVAFVEVRHPRLSWNATLALGARFASEFWKCDLRVWQRTQGPRLGWNETLAFSM